MLQARPLSPERARRVATAAAGTHRRSACRGLFLRNVPRTRDDPPPRSAFIRRLGARDAPSALVDSRRLALGGTGDGRSARLDFFATLRAGRYSSSPRTVSKKRRKSIRCERSGDRSKRIRIMPKFNSTRSPRTTLRELVARVDGLRERGGDLPQQLFTQSEGNALFLDEAIRGIAESRDPLDISTNVSSVIAARVERLGSEGRTVAEIASVAGSGCTLSLLREVSNLSTTSIARGLDELLDRRILREAGARSGADYVFSHHLIADAVYSEIDPAFRAQRHLRIAHCLEAVRGSGGSASPQEIGRHYERSGERSMAADWYLTAALSARDVHAHGDVITLATRALDNAETPEQQRAALYARESARGRRGDREGQRQDIELLTRLRDDGFEAEFDLTLRRVLLARSLGDSGEEIAYIERLQSLAGQLDDDARARASTEAATRASNASNAADSTRFALEALAIYERSGDVRGQLECLHLLVESTSNTGDLESAERYLALHSGASRPRSRTLRSKRTRSRSLRSQRFYGSATGSVFRSRNAPSNCTYGRTIAKGKPPRGDGSRLRRRGWGITRLRCKNSTRPSQLMRRWDTNAGSR